VGFRSRRAVPDETVFLTVPVDGWLKNGLVDLAEARGMSFQRLVGLILVNGLRDSEGSVLLGFVEPQDSLSGVKAYLRGERRLEPCGQASCVKEPVVVLGSVFCDVCGVCLG